MQLLKPFNVYIQRENKTRRKKKLYFIGLKPFQFKLFRNFAKSKLIKYYN